MEPGGGLDREPSHGWVGAKEVEARKRNIARGWGKPGASRRMDVERNASDALALSNGATI